MMSVGVVAIFKIHLSQSLLCSLAPQLSLPAFAIPVDFIENVIECTVDLFVVIDHMASGPLFIALTDKMGKNERKAVSKIAIITAAGLLIAFAVAGTQILTWFGITINSFMVAGGILLFIVSIELLTYGAWRFSGGARTDTGESG